MQLELFVLYLNTVSELRMEKEEVKLKYTIIVLANDCWEYVSGDLLYQ